MNPPTPSRDILASKTFRGRSYVSVVVGGQLIWSTLNGLVGVGVGSDLLFLEAYMVAGGGHIGIQGPKGVSLWRYVGWVGWVPDKGGVGWGGGRECWFPVQTWTDFWPKLARNKSKMMCPIFLQKNGIVSL